MPSSACSSPYPPIHKVLSLAGKSVQGKWDPNRQFLHATLAMACSGKDCENQPVPASPAELASKRVPHPQAPAADVRASWHGMAAPARIAAVPCRSRTPGLQHAAFVEVPGHFAGCWGPSNIA